MNSLINKSIKSLEKLPENKIHEVIDFIDFLYMKHIEEEHVQQGIEKIVNQAKSFSFLHNEEDIYDESDLIEKY